MTNTPTGPERPKFTSASIYNHPGGLLSFWYAGEWQVRTDPAPLPAVTLYPDPADPATFVSIKVEDLGAPLAGGERGEVVEGVRAGLAELDDCRVDSLAELAGDGPWGLEWKCAFLDGGRRVRRRARLFFSDHYQYAVVCQGSSEERYAYWQGMFEFTLLTIATAPFNLVNWAGSNAGDPA